MASLGLYRVDSVDSVRTIPSLRNISVLELVQRIDGTESETRFQGSLRLT
jgi:hypothetical protein